MAKVIIDREKIKEVLERGVEEVIVKENLEKKMLSGKQLRIKLGIDPTGSVLHLGHAVVLRKLKGFQDLGHQVIFLIGDFTAKIGDPTGRSMERKPMTDKEIKNNMKDYIKQAGLVLNMGKVEIRHNSEWLAKLNFQEVIMLTSKVTYAQVAQRADFKKRIKDDIDVSLQEFIYPVMQGYDSVALRADVEIGGTDQKFNLLMGRQLQKRYEQEEQDVVTCPLLEGLSGGDKMSKSLNNYIALNESANEMYGKIMSLSDSLIIPYFKLCTYLDLKDVDKIENEIKKGANPRDFKMKLAYEIVKIYHGEKGAMEAQEYFIKTIQKKETPNEVKSQKSKVKSSNIMDLLVEVGLAGSKSEARRLIEQGGIKVDEEVISDINKKIEATKDGVLIQRGKRQFVRVILN